MTDKHERKYNKLPIEQKEEMCVHGRHWSGTLKYRATKKRGIEIKIKT